jgi:hypothetical protein
MRTILSTILVAAACAVLSTSTLARGGGGGGGGGGGHGSGGGWHGGGGGGWHGGGYHGGGHWHGGYYGGWCCGYGVGIYLGSPWYWGSAYYPYYPAYYPAYYDYPAVQYAPVTQQAAPAPGAQSSGTPPDYVAPPAGTVQYYCPSGGYYPAVATCPQGWLRVVPH